MAYQGPFDVPMVEEMSMQRLARIPASLASSSKPVGTLSVSGSTTLPIMALPRPGARVW